MTGRLGLVALGLAAAASLAPRIATAQVRDTLAVGDTAAPGPKRIGPAGAFVRSLLVPGWGQSQLDRHVTGALLLAWEGVAMAMTLKANQQVDYLKQVESPSLEAKRQERQDWLVLWIFNHFFAGAEAFVSAHLREFPGDIRLRAGPNAAWIEVPLPPTMR